MSAVIGKFHQLRLSFPFKSERIEHESVVTTNVFWNVILSRRASERGTVTLDQVVDDFHAWMNSKAPMNPAMPPARFE